MHMYPHTTFRSIRVDVMPVDDNVSYVPPDVKLSLKIKDKRPLLNLSRDMRRVKVLNECLKVPFTLANLSQDIRRVSVLNQCA